MIKKVCKAAALVCALAVFFFVTGCADTSWAVKVNNVTVPSGVYITYLLSARSQVESNAASSSSSDSSSSESGLGGTSNAALSSSSTSSTSSTDVWSQKIEGKTALSWAINEAEQSSEKLALIEQLCKTHNLTLTSSEKSLCSSYAQQYYSAYSLYASNGVSSSSLERIFENSYLSSKLFDSYYAKGGSKAVSDTDAKSYYSKNFVHIKHILLQTTDDEGNTLSDAKIAEIKAKAEQIAAQAKADPSKFDSLVKQYNEDPGMTQSPDGYIFNKSSNYVQEFKDAAFSMKVGEIRVVKTSYGYHVMYRVALDPNASSFDTNKSTVLHAMKDTEFNSTLASLLKSASVKVNDSAINRYNPQKLKTS